MKYHKVAEAIKERIKAGEYLATGVPAERDLATMLGVSYMTVRRAVDELISDSTLSRKGNGRIEVAALQSGELAKPTPRIAFLVPSWHSGFVPIWANAVKEAARSYEVVMPTVSYVRIEDKVVPETLKAFDAVIFFPATDLPPEVEAAIVKASCRIVSIEANLTRLGIPSIQTLPPSSIRIMLDHLASLGHRSIDCLNTQPADSVIRDRIGEWRLWCSVNDVDGELHSEPEPIGGDPRGAAYKLTSAVLDEKAIDTTAFLCTTLDAAEGCMRAIRERGLTIGGDVSVCVVNDEGRAAYMHPTLTSLQMVDPTPYLLFALGEFLIGRKEWGGPMLMAPLEATLFKGESTGPTKVRADKGLNSISAAI